MAKVLRTIDAMLLMREMADLTNGGMTLHRCFDILRRQNKNAALARMLHQIQKELESGHSLSHALSLQNGFLSPIYIGLIRAGESAGTIESALEESALLLENEMETVQRVRSAFLYPAFLLVIAIAVCIFLTVFVIPRFEFLFTDLGQRLPLPTRLLIAFSVFIKKYLWILLAAIGGAIFAVTKTKSPWRNNLRDISLWIPGVSDLIRLTFLQRWAQVMGSMLKSGFTVSDALALSARTLDSSLVSHQVRSVLDRLHKGHTLKEALESSSLFPPSTCELIGAGEESGRLEEAFYRIAGSYKRQTDLRSKLMLSMLEPLLILGMGAVVGFVAIAMLLPIFEISASFR